jgi:hypothetical protein
MLVVSEGIGRIYQFTACDCFSKLLGWAKLYLDKTADSWFDFLENHLLKRTGLVRIKSFYRIMVRSIPLQSAFKDKHRLQGCL